MVKSPHTVNGKFYGMFYALEDGRSLYLAHRTPSQILFAKAAWCLDESTLRRCRTMGIYAVGVAMRRKGRPEVYLTHIDDFYGPNSFTHFGDAPQRGLPAQCFRLNPNTVTASIERRARLPRR